MNLSVSNIAWTAQQDARVYEIMKENGFSGLEIAPTRIFPEQPYEHREAAAGWARELKARHGLRIVSMQSIWYGVQERIFGTDSERRYLVDYTRKAVDFAEAAGCPNLVFGCPRNRCIPEGAGEETALDFFRELADYAALRHTVIAIEANPPIYNTNYINTTPQAMELAEQIASPGFKVNLDIGTILENQEPLSVIEGKLDRISHIHISEPGLKMIRRRPLHRELAALLRRENYQGYVSVEMGKTESAADIEETCVYIKEVFG